MNSLETKFTAERHIELTSTTSAEKLLPIGHVLGLQPR